MQTTLTRLFLCLIGLILLIVPAALAQSASVAGSVVSDKDETLVGTVITAVHLPTGIRRTAITDGAGGFSIPAMLHGGPYTLQIAQINYRPQLLTNIFLNAGQALQINVQLVTGAVAVGTRRADRTALESAVPVDVIDMRELATAAPQTDVTQLLTYVVPSFNSTRQTSADGSDHMDPASLRGLGTDQMLVLVNGKRRHTTALINLLGNRGVGNVGTDLNTLPSNGIDRVEILRDGAAAQYGSDAIAGVMNISLKTDNKGGNLLVNSGIHTEGDGLSTLVSLNKGMRLGKKGFLNLTGEADYRGSTTRNYSRDLNSWPVFSSDRATEDSALAANGKTYADFEQRNGNARIRNVRGVFNGGVVKSEKLRFYAFGGYNFRRGNAVAPWVLPSAQPNDIVKSIFPLGYQPNINTRIHDASGAVGTVLGLGAWSLDLSHVVGYNQMRYDLNNTLNASIGATSPTEFEAGGFQFLQNVSNATFTRLFPKVLAGTNVAFGTEYRTERYQIVAGDEFSSGEFDTGEEGASAGSQGFVGFGSASAEGSLGTRSNIGGFADVEVDVTKKWSVNTALRFENYSDFGSAFIYKVTSRLQLLKPLAVRAAYNTGFRAPSLQQKQYRQITLLPTPTRVTYSGLFNNTAPITVAAGTPSLQPERSRNISAGFILAPTPSFSLTADAYRIDIDDRIILSGLFGEGISAELDAALFRASTNKAQFFTNAVDTRTEGLDVVASYRDGLGRGTLLLSAAANFNQTTIRQVRVPERFASLETDRTAEGQPDLSTDYVNQRQLSLLQTGNPRSKAFFTAGYDVGKVGLLVRGTYFGRMGYYDYNSEDNDFGSYFLEFNPRFVTDLVLKYQPIKTLSFVVGAQNLFDVYPNTLLEAARNGRPPGEGRFATIEQFDAYYQNRFGRPSNLPESRDIFPYDPVQMGFNGRFVYLKVAYSLGL